jgi:hypothetical protein
VLPVLQQQLYLCSRSLAIARLGCSVELLDLHQVAQIVVTLVFGVPTLMHFDFFIQILALDEVENKITAINSLTIC